MSERAAFEAKHHAMRKSKDGTIVSFVVHPNDLSPELQCLPIGARVIIGWAQIGDDEKEIGPTGRPLEGSNDHAILANETGNRGTAGTSKPKRKFSEMSLPEQCALRCADGNFGRFFTEVYDFPADPDLSDTELVTRAVRHHLAINSRAELSTNHDAANAWRRIEAEFQRWLTDETYKGSVR